jgi:DNA-binding transcriptional regulator YhcF (GntR family)
MKPIYVQVAEAIEDDILMGKLQEGEPVYSQLILSRELNINPATAAKGINLLVQKEILEKQRGLSMTVAHGAKGRIKSEKREKEFQDMSIQLVDQAIKLGLSKEQVLTVISNLFAGDERGGQDE